MWLFGCIIRPFDMLRSRLGSYIAGGGCFFRLVLIGLNYDMREVCSSLFAANEVSIMVEFALDRDLLIDR